MSSRARIARLLLAAVVAVPVGLAGVARAADIRIAVRTDVSSIDPHFHVYVPNAAVAHHIFASLVDADTRGRIVPNLAENWRRLDDQTWEFTLRPGLTFHDGSAVTAADVAFTFARAPKVPSSPSSFSQYTKLVERVEAVDARVFRIHTRGPAPTLLIDIANIGIIPKATEGATTADYNSGKAAIGAGPYKFVSWTAGDRLELVKNPGYWAGAEPWDRVTYRPVANDGARVAGILSGDVDMIEGVPGVDRARIAANPALSLAECDAFRIIYIVMDSNRDLSPGVFDLNGKPLDRNPLKDVRVRRAISMAINRQGLVDRLLSGQAHSAGQYVPPDVAGASPKLQPLPFDADGAKQLMREAGWGDGFSIVLASSNDRFPNDAQVAQAVGQMLARVGIKSDVQTMPASILFSRGTKLEFSVMLSGWVGNGEP